MSKSILENLARGAALLASSLALAGCNMSFGGFSGVPLSELDMSGEAPTEIALAGPDDVILTVGGTLDIQVEGDPKAVEALRFDLSGNSLDIGRDSDFMGGSDQKAIVRVTMPAPEEVSLAGSGTITGPTLAENSEISIAGSGAVNLSAISSKTLEVSVAGSGRLQGAGTATNLEIGIAGSGDVDFAGLTADNVEISIAGSGDVMLASDGSVDASIAGSGDITVTGSATCNVSAAGSGKMTCRPKAATAEPSPTPEGGNAVEIKGE